MREVNIIEVLHNDVTLPKYETKGSAGMDVRAYLPNGDIVIPPNEWKLIPTGLVCAIPERYELQIRPRSGLALKYGITVLNSPATIDSDYRGEIKVLLINHGKTDFRVSHGDRIAQFILSKVHLAEFVFVDKLSSTNRGMGGFGSTGV